jgi:hypothetical protein
VVDAQQACAHGSREHIAELALELRPHGHDVLVVWMLALSATQPHNAVEQAGVSFDDAHAPSVRHGASENRKKPRKPAVLMLMEAWGGWLGGGYRSAATRSVLATASGGANASGTRSASPARGAKCRYVIVVRNLDVFSTQEIFALVRAAACEHDAAVFLMAAFTGLRRAPSRRPNSMRPSIPRVFGIAGAAYRRLTA